MLALGARDISGFYNRANLDFPFNMAASIYKPGEFFREYQLQGTANRQTTSEEVIVDVTGEEENEERCFEDLENDIADNDRGRPQKKAQKPQQEHVNAQQHKNSAKKKKRDQRSFHGLQRKQIFVCVVGFGAQ